MSEVGSEINFAQLSAAAIDVLDRVLALSHQGEGDFAPLAECQRAARRLRDQLTTNEMPVDVIAALVDGTHPLGAMAQLVNGTEQLSDVRWTELQAAIRGAAHEVFSDSARAKALSTAIARGKLTTPDHDNSNNAETAQEPGGSDINVLSCDEEPDLANGSTVISRQPVLDTDSLLDILDSDDGDDTDDGGGWIFDDVDDAPSSNQASMIMHSRVDSSRPAKNRHSSSIDLDGDEDSVASRRTTLRSTRESGPKEFFRFMLYGDSGDRELLVPKQQLCLGWRFSEVVLFEYYLKRCRDNRERGFTSCCSDPFSEISASLGLPQRRLRESCVILEQRGQILIIPNQTRECRVWISDGHLEAAGQRPIAPQPDDDNANGTASCRTVHTYERRPLAPGLQQLLTRTPRARTGS